MVATIKSSIFMLGDAKPVKAQLVRVIEQLAASEFYKAAKMLGDARDDLLISYSLQKPHWRQICSNNPEERLEKEIRRRTDVVGIFSNATLS